MSITRKNVKGLKRSPLTPPVRRHVTRSMIRTAKPKQRQRSKYRQIEIIKIIADLFNATDKQLLSLVEILEAVGGSCSKPTLIQVRRYMGCELFRARGHYYWRRPTRRLTADGKIDLEKMVDPLLPLPPLPVSYVNQIKREIELELPSVRILRDFMEAANVNYSDEANNLIRAMQGAGYSKLTAMRAKSFLGAKSFRHGPDKRHKAAYWVWAYPAPVVVDWLIELLHESALPYNDIVHQAQKKGWSADVVNAARLKAGGIFARWHHKTQQFFWYDINSDHQELPDEERVCAS